MSNGQIVFSNLAATTLASAAASGATSMSLSAGTGALFPNPGTGQYFIACITPASGGTPPEEIVFVTSRSTDTVTVIRAQESTSAQNWGIGANFQLDPTAYTLTCMGQYQIYAGNPNGNVPGTVASGASPPSMVWDTVDGLAWICIGTGTAGTAQWIAQAPLNSPTFTGVPSGPTAAAATATAQLATTTFVTNSPQFAGTPRAPTASAGTSTTQLATTAFVVPGSTLATNGTQINPDGSIDQWGQQSFPDIGGSISVAISFNSAFPTQVLALGFTVGLATGFVVYGMINETTVTTSGFSAVLVETASVVQTGGVVRWWARGK